MTTTHTTRTTFVTFAKVSTYASLFLLYSLAVVTSATLCALSPAYTKHVGQAFQARIRHRRMKQELPTSIVPYAQYASVPLVEAVKVEPAQCVLSNNQGGVEVGIVQPEEAWMKRIQVLT
jgi:hypothetical protein